MQLHVGAIADQQLCDPRVPGRRRHLQRRQGPARRAVHVGAMVDQQLGHLRLPFAPGEDGPVQQRRHRSSGAAVVRQGSVDEGGVGLQEGAEGLGVAGLDGVEGGLEVWVVHPGFFVSVPRL